MALKFNGTSDYVDLGNSSTLNPVGLPCTMCAWVYLDDASAVHQILCRDDASLGRSFSFGFSGGFLGMEVQGAVQIGSGANIAMAAGQWYHCAVTGGAGAVWTAYVNALSLASGNTALLGATTGSTTIGERTYAGFNQWMTGKIAHVAMYRSILSPAEIGLLAGGALPSQIRQSDLLGYWPLRAGRNASADQSQHGNLAVLRGTVPFDDPPFLIRPILHYVLSTNPAEGEMPVLAPSVGVPTGTLAATETPDTAAFNGAVAVTGTLATTESPDTAAFNGNTVVSGTWASTEAADTAALSGNTVASGSFAVTEVQDVASFAGSGIVSGTFAATDTPDSAVLSGNAGTSGSLSATTSQDVASFAGNFGIAGAWVSTEASDLAVFIGQFGIASGTLAANDNVDIAAFIGSASGAPSGSLGATELPDNVVFLIDYMAPPSVTAASPYPSPFDYGWSYGEPPLRPGMPGSGTGRSS